MPHHKRGVMNDYASPRRARYGRTGAVLRETVLMILDQFSTSGPTRSTTNNRIGSRSRRALRPI